MTYRVWDDDKERVVHEVEVVGYEDAQVFKLGTMKAVIVFEHEQAQVFAKKIWLSHQDRDLADWLVQTLRGRFLWPNRPINIEVDITQPALLQALDGLPIFSHAMEKLVNRVNEPYLTGICIPILMEQEEVAYFHGAMKQRLANWSRDMTIGPELQVQYAEPGVSRHILETWLRSVGTGRHYYLKVVNGGFEEVGRLWLQLIEDSRLIHLKYIEVDPDKRRLGFGKGAVALCEAISSLMGFNMRVDIFGENPAAEQLFRSTGFVTVAKLFVMTDL